jgi:hypothetical protein
LPPTVESITDQVERAMHQFKAHQTDLSKYIFLMNIQTRNETLFYRLLVDNLEATMPIV